MIASAKSGSTKNIASLVFLGLLILLFTSLIRTLYVSFKTQDRIREQEARVQVLEQEVAALEKKAQEATSSFTLEEKVRNDLKMQRPNEKMYRIQP